jgi:transcriptional regulator with XRE-family HTH domain
MTVCDAVATRVENLLKEKNMRLYHLEKKSGILHGSMECIMQRRNKKVMLNTIMMLARGFDMSFLEFLDDPIFFDEELEIE